MTKFGVAAFGVTRTKPPRSAAVQPLVSTLLIDPCASFVPVVAPAFVTAKLGSADADAPIV